MKTTASVKLWQQMLIKLAEEPEHRQVRDWVTRNSAEILYRWGQECPEPASLFIEAMLSSPGVQLGPKQYTWEADLAGLVFLAIQGGKGCSISLSVDPFAYDMEEHILVKTKAGVQREFFEQEIDAVHKKYGLASKVLENLAHSHNWFTELGLDEMDPDELKEWPSEKWSGANVLKVISLDSRLMNRPKDEDFSKLIHAVETALSVNEIEKAMKPAQSSGRSGPKGL